MVIKGTSIDLIRKQGVKCARNKPTLNDSNTLLLCTLCHFPASVILDWMLGIIFEDVAGIQPHKQRHSSDAGHFIMLA